MKIYLINKQTLEVQRKYTNIISWHEDYVAYNIGTIKARIYCNPETEYFTDIIPEQEVLDE